MTLLYLIAGEASGDMLGAGLMQSLITKDASLRFAGVGGESMEKQGLTSLFPYQHLSIMGFLEILPSIPKILYLLHKTAKDIEEKQPSMVISIDSPGFTFRLAKKLRNHPKTKHIKLVHYVAPTVWAYKPERAKKTAKLFDGLLTLLPFEPAYFEKEGLKSFFVGHPVLWQQETGDAVAFRLRHKLKTDEKILLILPGSRKGEVKRHIALFMQAAKALPDYRTVIIANKAIIPLITPYLAEGTIICDIAEKYDAFAASQLALSKSGTVTLELAKAGVTMVVAHKVNAFSAWLIRKMLLIRHVSLINIATDSDIIPELIQENCTLKNITAALKELENPAIAEKQKADYLKAIAVLKGNNTIPPNDAAAEVIAKLY